MFLKNALKKRIGKRKKNLVICSHPVSIPQHSAFRGKHNPLRQAHMPQETCGKLHLYITLIPFLTLSVAHSQFYFHVCLHRLQVDAFLTLKIPQSFRSNIYASFSHSNQYRHQIQCAQNSFSRNIMRITIRAVSKTLRTLRCRFPKSVQPFYSCQNSGCQF